MTVRLKSESEFRGRNKKSLWNRKYPLSTQLNLSVISTSTLSENEFLFFRNVSRYLVTATQNVLKRWVFRSTICLCQRLWRKFNTADGVSPATSLPHVNHPAGWKLLNRKQLELFLYQVFRSFIHSILISLYFLPKFLFKKHSFALSRSALPHQTNFLKLSSSGELVLLH